MLLRRILEYVKNPSMFPLFNLNKLENRGERIDINMQNRIDFKSLNIFQKAHYNRYSFVRNDIEANKKNLDIACGTGYGTVLLSEISEFIDGYDIDEKVIQEIKKRYSEIQNLHFGVMDLIKFEAKYKYDNIISFETLEHFEETDILKILNKFYDALVDQGVLYFSVPYMQKRDWRMKILGHHKTFEINELKLKGWLSQIGFNIEFFKYQNYLNFEIQNYPEKAEMIICKVVKK